MKLKTKGGFSSKLRIKSLIEGGHEAHTHIAHNPPQVTEPKCHLLKALKHKRRQVITGEYTGNCAWINRSVA